MSFNKWAYANGNPIYYTDPSGHDPIVPPTTVGELGSCLGVAIIVVVDGPALETLCLLLAAGVITISVIQQNPDLVEAAVAGCEDAFEQLIMLAKGGQTGILTGAEHRAILAEAERIAGVKWGGGGKPPDRAICRALQELERAARIDGNDHQRGIIRQVFKAIRCDR